MATFYEFFNEQKYADAVKNVSVTSSKAQLPTAPHSLSMAFARTYLPSKLRLACLP